MSKFRDRIRDSARRQRAGLGFAPAATAVRGYVLVLAEVTGGAEARVAVAAGVGALLYTGDLAALAAVVQAAGPLPIGVRLEAATADQAREAAEANADFLLFDDGRAGAEALLERRLGRVLLLDADPDENRLRMLAPLDLDAILLPALSRTTTVRDLLRLRRIVDLARAPLAIPLHGPAVPVTTLEVWRDAGAPIVLVPHANAAALGATVQAATAVRAPSQPREERSEALLSSAAARPAEIAHDDDFDDFIDLD